ncbi:hypothetical protein SAMN06265379_102202 [Saccharicrinis carchari]|uniref:Uncharacterized protein n=1 Tax=Saccharicrinis carchari TaxID=1168039 RepID=A0A521BY55_SACCC|nr:hypothetical protein SAMN06265379_102202 [Saccharicrinis carchari]
MYSGFGKKIVTIVKCAMKVVGMGVHCGALGCGLWNEFQSTVIFPFRFFSEKGRATPQMWGMGINSCCRSDPFLPSETG